MYRRIVLIACLLFVGFAAVAQADSDQPPAGFVSLFNGKNLDGWWGETTTNPATYLNDKLPQRKAKSQDDIHKHWSVKNGDLVSDGHGLFLTTDKSYGDFEMYVDWLMVSHNGDSGIYLRGYPQVQIWDPSNKREVKNGAPKGSGALWNDNADNPGKWPLVKADKPVGEWNTFHIKMIGSHVWVWFNGKLTVDGAVMDNYYDRKMPVLAHGPIQLQTHGSEMHFRNVFIREIPVDEANKTLSELAGDGFEKIFNGKNWDGWAGPLDNYQINDGGTLMCKKGKGGTIYTKKQYGDFAVHLQFKLPPAGNNGLAIRYPGHGDTAYDGMCECQVLDNTAPQYEHLHPQQYHGSIYGQVPAKRGYLRPVGDWNYEIVTVKGHRLTCELNGTVITDADVSTLKPDDFMYPMDHFKGRMRLYGHFGFAGHNDAVEFREVYLKDLGGASSEAANK